MQIKIDNEIIKTYTATETAIAESLIPSFQEWYNKGVVNRINKGVSNKQIIDTVDAKIITAMKRLGIDKDIIKEKGLCEETIALAEEVMAKPGYKSRKTRDLERNPNVI